MISLLNEGIRKYIMGTLVQWYNGTMVQRLRGVVAQALQAEALAQAWLGVIGNR
jgi:hypothetical protein